MTSCSLFASGLVSQVSGAVPTFSYRRTGHNGDYFGIQMTYLNGQSTCYQTGTTPRFTPVIQNTRAGYSVNCHFDVQGMTSTGIYCPSASVTNVPDGILTVSYIDWYQGQPTPVPFLATFGPSPAPRAVATTIGTVVTSTATSTLTVPPEYASTATMYSAVATQTFTSTAIVTRTQTTTNTNFVTSCAAPPSISDSSKSSSNSAVPSTATTSVLPSGITNSCPADNGKHVYTSAGTFQIQCSYDRDGTTTGLFHTDNGLLGCINLCANTEGCVWSTYYKDHPRDACYLKFGSGTANYNTAAWGAKLISGVSSTVIPSGSGSTGPSMSSSMSTSSPAISSLASASSSIRSTSNSATSLSLTLSSSSESKPPGAPTSSPSSSSSAATSRSSDSTRNLPSIPSSGLSSSSATASISPAASSDPVQRTSSSISIPSSSTGSATSSSTTVSLSSTARDSSSTPSTSFSSSAGSSAAAPIATSSDLSCPGDNGKTVNTGAGSFVIECYYDRTGGDIGAQYSDGGFSGCIQLCANTPTCVDVSYSPNGPCYLKNLQGSPNTNSGIWGARLANIPRPSAVGSSTGISSPTATSTSSVNEPICPGSDGKIFYTNGDIFSVECYTDYKGGDLPSGTPQYNIIDFGTCIIACATKKACNAVSYGGSTCYLKGAANPSSPNTNVWAAKQIGTYDDTTTRITATPTTRASSTASLTSSTLTQTVTVTTTISGAGYQCTCTPTNGLDSGPALDDSLSCPSSDASTFTSDCGAKYAIECYSDRFGDDIPGGTSYLNTFKECIADCDHTAGCVDVSYIPGAPGPCYKKSRIAEIRRNDNVFGARQLSNCTAPVKLKLHRKRVVRVQTILKRHIQKRGFYGPDFTYVQGTTTTTQTTTSTSVRHIAVTATPDKAGITTTTVYTTAGMTTTVTDHATITQTQQTAVTTCPAVTKRAVPQTKV